MQVAAGAASAAGLFKNRNDLPYCSWKNDAWSLAAQGFSLVPLSYNLYAFVVVHRLLTRTLELAQRQRLLEAERESIIQRRLRLWPRFVAYSLSFVCTQIPDIIGDVIAMGSRNHINGDGHTLWAVLFDSVAQLHGAANGVIFGVTHRRLYTSPSISVDYEELDDGSGVYAAQESKCPGASCSSETPTSDGSEVQAAD